MMDQEQARLETDSALGQQYKNIWEYRIGPFFEAKRVQLFEAFCSCNSADKEQMQLIKLQMNALESLKAEVQSHIETGKMADIQLKELNDGQ